MSLLGAARSAVFWNIISNGSFLCHILCSYLVSRYLKHQETKIIIMPLLGAGRIPVLWNIISNGSFLWNIISNGSFLWNIIYNGSFLCRLLCSYLVSRYLKHQETKIIIMTILGAARSAILWNIISNGSFLGNSTSNGSFLCRLLCSYLVSRYLKH